MIHAQKRVQGDFLQNATRQEGREREKGGRERRKASGTDGGRGAIVGS